MASKSIVGRFRPSEARGEVRERETDQTINRAGGSDDCISHSNPNDFVRHCNSRKNKRVIADGVLCIAFAVCGVEVSIGYRDEGCSFREIRTYNAGICAACIEKHEVCICTNSHVNSDKETVVNVGQRCFSSSGRACTAGRRRADY